MGWTKAKLVDEGARREQEEKAYRKKYAAPLPDHLVRLLGQSFFDELTEELRLKVEQKRYVPGSLFSSSYYKESLILDLECADRPEQDRHYHDHYHYSFFPENDYMCILGGEDNFILWYKNIRHVDPVFRYAEQLCRKGDLKVDYQRTRRQILFSVSLPCDRNGKIR